jgi:hypothetical protein
MGTRLSIVAGLLAGLLAAAALLAGFVFVGPDPVRATPSSSPSGSEDAAGSPSASAPVASGSAVASGSPAASGASAAPGSPGGSAVTENFHVGEAAPALLLS